MIWRWVADRCVPDQALHIPMLWLEVVAREMRYILRDLDVMIWGSNHGGPNFTGLQDISGV